MQHAIINQYGMYIQGKEYDQIMSAIQNDKESVTIDNIDVDIIKHTTDKDGNKITLVQVKH